MKDGKVEIVDEVLDIKQTNGAVIWFNKKLFAPVSIEYTVTIVDDNCLYDRVADMNCFWMANDPKSEFDFFKYTKERKGVFSSYFSHTLYYVGQGGHNNTKTRFRKYMGNGKRPLKSEHDLSDSLYRILPNKKNRIKIIVSHNRTQYYCNDNLIYNVVDDSLYGSGYFGIRSYKNHMKVDNVVISTF